MLSTKQWVDLLNQQYALTVSSSDGNDLLLATRKFIRFLGTDAYSQLFLERLRDNLEESENVWHETLASIVEERNGLEKRIRDYGANLANAVEELNEVPVESERVLVRFQEDDWYRAWTDMTDVIQFDNLDEGQPPLTKTGRMLAHLLNITSEAVNLSRAINYEPKIAEDLKSQVQKLIRYYKSAQRIIRNDWWSSGLFTLKQLQTVIRIYDLEIFIEPDDYKPPRLSALASWSTLMITNAPSDIAENLSFQFRQLRIENKDFREITAPLIRMYTRRLYEDIQAIAASRLAHQHVVERYKVRCENYDWENIAGLIGTYREEREGSPKYVEKLLTLHFSKYLYDHGYKVHYALRNGAHEPDLIGVGEDPILVEAKVVGQVAGTSRRRAWIIEGLKQLLGYLNKYYSEYGITEGYLVVFRDRDANCPMYSFDAPEWHIGHFTIVPVLINLAKITTPQNRNTRTELISSMILRQLRKDNLPVYLKKKKYGMERM